mgnify:CR=1 FL=1
MDKIEKLFRRLSPKDRAFLRATIDALHDGEKKGLQIKKLAGSDFHRLRKGIFRIIFHYDKAHTVIIDSIRIRSEKTYRDF